MRARLVLFDGRAIPVLPAARVRRHAPALEEDLHAVQRQAHVHLLLHQLAASALRWVRRRVLAVRALLTVLCTLYPERFGRLEPRLEAFSSALDSQAVLPCLRAIAEERLGALPAPAGFFRQWNGAGLAGPAHAPHAQGLDPPPAAA